MNIKPPICDNNYLFDKKRCLCIKKSKKEVTKKVITKKVTIKKGNNTRKRCPKGTRKHPITKLCEPVNKNHLLTKSKPIIEIPNEKRTRCPKGSRKNPKSKLCEPKIAKSANPKTVKHVKYNRKVKTKKSKKTFVIPSVTPLDVATLGNEVARHIREKKKINPTKMDTLIKSFSPSIHAQLLKFNTSLMKKNDKTKESIATQQRQLLDCLGENALASLNIRSNEVPKIIFLNDKLLPKIYVKGNCVTYSNMKAQKLLLKSLEHSIKHIDVSKVITPAQYASNCWFNTFFVTFFIADKGRKFSKTLRHLMITQKGPQQKSKINLNMRKTMACLNLGIEASLTGNPLAYKINTNSFIVSLALSIPKKYQFEMPKYNEASNPLYFYDVLMNYFSLEHGIKGIKMSQIQIVNKGDIKNIKHTMKQTLSNEPDLLTIEVYDNSHDDFNASKHAKKPKIIRDGSKEYHLGTVIIRDTLKKHFCCVCDVNGKPYGFDGVSFKRLNPFEWRPFLNKNKNWTFEGSVWKSKLRDKKPILWNFMNGYQILFYYRVK